MRASCGRSARTAALRCLAPRLLAFRAPGSARHEVDELLDAPQQGGVEVVERRHLAEDVLPRPGDVGLVRCGQPSCWQVPVFQSMLRGTSGQRAMPSRAGLTACQMSMNGCPTISTCLPIGDRAMSWAMRLSLEPVTRWSTSTPTRRSGPGRKSRRWSAQVVDAAEELHDDALDPQVVAPDLLDQLGVVAALDEDPAGPGDPGLGAVDGDRAAGGARRPAPAPPRAAGAVRITGRPSSRKPGPSGKVRRLPRRSSSVSVSRSRSTATISPHHVGRDLLDHRAQLGGRLDGAAALGGAPVGGEDVGAVAVAGGHRRNARWPRGRGPG